MEREAGNGALFSIGQMAKLFDMNIRTLRYYDQIGLLKPETVNKDTGYRYYSSAQFERLNTIKYLRALDVPIERIATFFEGRDVELMRDIFEKQLDRVGRKRRELARIERKIRGRIAQIDDAVEGALDNPEIRNVAERRVVRLAESFAPTADLEPLIRDLGRRSNLNDAIFLGKVGVSVSREDLEARSYGRLSSVFITVERADSHAGSVERIAGGPFACIRFRGTHGDSARHYAKLVDFIGTSGLAIMGDSVEITLIDAGMTSDESRFVTELQIPVIQPSNAGAAN